MGKYAQFIMGPAGSGKSTYAKTIITHCQTLGRNPHLVNLDPAAETFEYPPSIDIRDLISVDDVMEELGFGPNGGLVYCLEFLLANMDWLEEQLADYQDDYLIIDCPGQIEIFTHFPIMKEIISMFQRLNYNTVGVYLIDCQFITDESKYFSGVLSAMSAMVQLEIPHINIMSKMDLLGSEAESETVARFLEADTGMFRPTESRYHRLTEAIVRLIDDYTMISFIPLNIQDEDSVEAVLSQVDVALQFGEDEEVQERADFDGYDNED